MHRMPAPFRVVTTIALILLVLICVVYAEPVTAVALLSIAVAIRGVAMERLPPRAFVPRYAGTSRAPPV